MRKTKLSPISKRRIQQYKDELPERIFICERASGTWVSRKGSLVGGYCKGGVCEYCGKPANHSGNWANGFRLEPHEEIHRGNGGKLNRQISKMACRPCHIKEQHKKLKREKVKRII